MQHIFILGNNPNLSIAEISAVLPKIKIIKKYNKLLIAERADFNCQEVLNQLGGTIKIGQVISDKVDGGKIIEEIITQNKGGKVRFGLSYYLSQVDKKLGMEIKKELKNKGISSRLVTSRENNLSSVIIKKEKVIDFLVGPEFLGLTCAVQDFEDYSHRDFGRPKSDALSGMLPPKLAKMMINLAQVKSTDLILDPFCGSGTILSEAIVLDYKNLIGCDKSEKAISDTKENLKWLINKSKIINHKSKIFICDVRNLSKQIKASSIDVIITEPYLGPPIKGNESEKKMKKVVSELSDLYLIAFNEFKKVLKDGARVVIVLPEWHLLNNVFGLEIEKQVSNIGFEKIDQNNLIYKRQKQKVWRRINIYKKKSE